MVKAPKDNNAPKAPLRPFFAYKAKHYQRVLKSMPNGYSLGELTKKISAQWNALPEADKVVYQDAFKVEMTKYTKMMNAYKLTGNYQKHQLKLAEFKASNPNSKKQKFKKDENAPKKAKTAFFCFMDDKRETLKAEFPDLPHKELIKKMSTQWNALSEEDKKPFAAESAKLKAAYDKAQAAYIKTDGYKEYQKLKAEHVKAQKSLKKEKAKKSKSPKKAKSPKAKKSKSPKKAKKAAKKVKGGKKPKGPKKSARKAKRVSKSKAKATKSKARKAKKKVSSK